MEEKDYEEGLAVLFTRSNKDHEGVLTKDNDGDWWIASNYAGFGGDGLCEFGQQLHGKMFVDLMQDWYIGKIRPLGKVSVKNPTERFTAEYDGVIYEQDCIKNEDGNFTLEEATDRVLELRAEANALNAQIKRYGRYAEKLGWVA